VVEVEEDVVVVGVVVGVVVEADIKQIKMMTWVMKLTTPILTKLQMITHRTEHIKTQIPKTLLAPTLLIQLQ